MHENKRDASSIDFVALISFPLLPENFRGAPAGDRVNLQTLWATFTATVRRQI